jgi:Ca2+-binding RTX toxin-like protein
MATLSTEQQELEELKDPTASTFDTLEAGIIKPVFSTNENTQLEILKELETDTSNSVDKDDTQIIIGTPNADTLNGANGNDIITSLDVDDIVSGRNGDDLISGGGGNDYLLGDAGKDVVFGDFSPSADSEKIASGNDSIFGGEGNDQLYGQDRQDLIYGDSGNDYIEGGTDNDEINGDDGNDILYGDNIEGSPSVSGDDTISGNNGNDKIYGGRGNDSLEGGAGKDLLVGEQGYDSLNGGDGNDILIGTDIGFSGQLQQGFGFGEKDVLIGGKNNDTFVLGLEKANARVNGVDSVIFYVLLYNDGNSNASGTQDYALIKDFGFINDGVIRGVDKIQLAGSASDYFLGASPDSSISGTGIFYTPSQSESELLGIVEGISVSNLSLSNNDQFIFV